MIRQVVLITLLVLSWCAADAAAPAQKGAYIGGMVGVTTLEDDGLFGGLSVDDSDSGIGIFGGYKFFKHLSVEGRYTDFGTFAVEGLGVDASVLSVHVLGIIPFGDSGWELFGQLGLGTVDIDIVGDSTSESVGSAGLGVRYSFSENFSLGVQTDAYAYEEVDFVSTYNVGVVITALAIRLSF
jgi:OOP family OmpA-OmpF porin